MSSELSRAGRADHARNRARILAAAGDLFRQRPIADIGLEDVAAAAGVGRATLFRHIGSKEALVAEVYRDRLLDLHELSAAALEYEDPWEGFVVFLRTVAGWMAEDRGLHTYISERAQRPDDEAVATLIGEMDRVLGRARDARQLRPFLQVQDLMPLLSFTVSAPAERNDDIVEVLLRGLRV